MCGAATIGYRIAYCIKAGGNAGNSATRNCCSTVGAAPEVVMVVGMLKTLAALASHSSLASHIAATAAALLAERGAEAAAATAAIIRTKCAAVRTLEFVADHPFLLALVHRPNNVLFIGRFVTSD